MEETKLCKKCSKDLPLSCFDMTTNNKDKTRMYPRNICKNCRKEQRRQRDSIPENQQKKAAYRLNYNRTHLDKVHAWNKRGRQKHREQLSLKGKKRYRANREYHIAQARLNRVQHREIISVRRHIRYMHNREQKALIDAKYRKQPHVKAKREANNRRRESLKRVATGTFTLSQFYARCEYYGWCCYLCGKSVTRQTVSIEHRIPITRGGSNWPANLAPACRSCNSRKHTKTEQEYRQYLAKYRQFLA